MHQVFSLCKAFEERVLTTDIMSKFWCQSRGPLGSTSNKVRWSTIASHCWGRSTASSATSAGGKVKERAETLVHHQAWFGQVWIHCWMRSVWCHQKWQEKHWSSTHSNVQREGGEFASIRRRQSACRQTYCKGRCWKSPVRSKKCLKKAPRSFMDTQVRDHKESLKNSRCLHALTSKQGIWKEPCQKVPVGTRSGGESAESSREETSSSLNLWILV